MICFPISFSFMEHKHISKNKTSKYKKKNRRKTNKKERNEIFEIFLNSNILFAYFQPGYSPNNSYGFLGNCTQGSTPSDPSHGKRGRHLYFAPMYACLKCICVHHKEVYRQTTLTNALFKYKYLDHTDKSTYNEVRK